MSRKQLLILVWAAFSLMPGCFVRRRHVAAPAAALPNRPLLTATKNELVQRLHEIYDPIQSFLMRADLSPSVTNPSQRAVTDYATISAFVLFRKPDEIRVIGQDPVLHATIFDMVSMGNEFRVNIPPKNRFIVGKDDVPGTSSNKLENLRPTAFLAALLIQPPDPATGITLLEASTEGKDPVYILLIAQRNQNQFRLVRNIYFDRYTLQVTRQRAFDPAGNIISETKYSEWKPYQGIPFPCEIEIQRPQDNYEVQLTVGTMDMNGPQVTPEKFVLNQPEGTDLQQLN